MCMFQLRFYYNRMAFKLTTLNISCKTYWMKTCWDIANALAIYSFSRAPSLSLSLSSGGKMNLALCLCAMVFSDRLILALLIWSFHEQWCALKHLIMNVSLCTCNKIAENSFTHSLFHSPKQHYDNWQNFVFFITVSTNIFFVLFFFWKITSCSRSRA